jgi:DNA polymerase-3 subunit epsilon
MNVLEAEIAITALQATGNYTVLRKLDLDLDSRFSKRQVCGSKIGLCLDTETTGLNHAEDKMIEVGIVAFEFDPATGEILRVVARYNGFEDPGCPLPTEITEITGITDEMVVGQAFDDDRISSLADMATLVVAHNAAFDRKFVEDRYPLFAKMPWACSLFQIDWSRERIGSRTLEYLLYKCGGYSIKAHRALDDAEGVLGLLLGEFPVTRAPIFKELLTRSKETTSKIVAVGAPYGKKDELKQRGYRWSDGTNNGLKGWWTSIAQQQEEGELAYLAKEIYPAGNIEQVEVSRIDAYARFSTREG